MKTLYLHIGTPKTGTSALQSFFLKNRERLYEDGIWYPDLAASLKWEEKLKVFSGNGINFRELTVSLEDMEAEKKKFFQDMFQKFKNCDTNILLSDEILYLRNETIYQNLVEQGFEVKVIVFFRRQDLWGESHWNQIVKLGRCAESCFDTIQKIDMDYYQKCKRIADIVGKENLLVSVYGENDIFTNFLNKLGIQDTSKYQKDKYQANPSLSANFVEIKRILNGIPDSAILNEDARELLEEGRQYALTDESVKHAPSFLSREERKVIIQKYHESNTMLAKEFLDRETLFDETIEDSDDSGIDTKTIYQDMIKYFGMLAVHQYKEIEKVKDSLYKFQIPEQCEGKNLLVYGIDRLGSRLYQQIKAEMNCKEIIAVDRKWGAAQENYKIPVCNPEVIHYGEFDYVLIAVRDERTYEAIREYLLNKKKVPEENILRMKLEA